MVILAWQAEGHDAGMPIGDILEFGGMFIFFLTK